MVPVVAHITVTLALALGGGIAQETPKFGREFAKDRKEAFAATAIPPPLPQGCGKSRRTIWHLQPGLAATPARLRQTDSPSSRCAWSCRREPRFGGAFPVRIPSTRKRPRRHRPCARRSRSYP